MNAVRPPADWTGVNQRVLAAELARLKARLEPAGDRAAEEAALVRAREALPAPAAIDRLTDLFGLSPFERDLLLLCAGTEMDGELARRCGEARGLPHQPWATFGLALEALPDPHWSALAPDRPLRRWRLIEVGADAGLIAASLRIDERVLHYLAGINALDARLEPLLSRSSPAGPMAESHRRIAAEIRGMLPVDLAPAGTVVLYGNDPAGQEAIASEVAARLGLRLCQARADDLPANAQEAHAFATLWLREAALLPAALLVRCAGAVPDSVQHLLERLGGLLLICAGEPVVLRVPALRFRVDRPGPAEQRELWVQCLGPSAPRLDGALDAVAAQFSLSAGAIQEAAARLDRSSATAEDPALALWETCRDLGRRRLDDLAQRIAPAAAWDDLVVPGPQLAALRQIAVHQRHRMRVHEEWGFAAKGARGLGLGVLFAGESGTGKTMAAEVLARELALDLYRIDLSAVVSKYIGETEKNLRRVFDAAEDSGAILLFDEADALFGRRSEVRDSHDRYANIEVSYLLQRMEVYRGLAILTTNQKAALDTAFERRLRFVVQFPFPDAVPRAAIWRGIFPPRAPVNGLDYDRLSRLSATGGSIRNIALNAAFLAAEAGSAITMPLLLRAAQLEAAKREKPLTDAEIRGWA